ncbi:Heme A synthase, cytochrome oxidase biogenesis protein Cox15-CtaA [Minicystis rosea]|nr:Heme A synthase, cytochrome oxidase biogenesis protein Cox15-CtaA [Minicystis rosea]
MQRLRRFSWATLGVTLAVILWGAYVRVSGSGAGCGKEWPICRGKLVPTMTSLETLVEYAHRASSGFVTVMVLVQLLWALAVLPRRHPARRGAGVSTFFVMTEGAVGAAIVLFERVAHDKSAARAAWMSLHLVNTFLLIASLACTAWWMTGRRVPRLRGHGTAGLLVGGGFAGLLAVGVTGALTALGDTLFGAKTLAEGVAADFSPTAHFLQQIRVSHPIVAVLVGMYLLYARQGIAAGRGPDAERLSRALGALVITQLLCGVVNFMLMAPAWMQMVHLLVADLVWIAFILLSVTALAEDGAEPAIAGGTAAPIET